MTVDSALAEQVVFDVIASAFDSADSVARRFVCSALQDDVADRILTMLASTAELSLRRTDRINVDIGPVIFADEAKGIIEHVERMQAAGNSVERLPLPATAANGTFRFPDHHRTTRSPS